MSILSLGLIWALIAASPAAAAAPCTGINCYRYYADITIAAWANPPAPVFPGDTHSYTVRVTNTGWRTGGSGGPIAGLGPDSGPVYVVFVPSSPDEYPIFRQHDSGVAFRCQGYYGNGLACDAPSLPTGTTSQFTVVFQASRSPGTYTCAVYADSFGWTEYNENNNSQTLTYQVGYLA